MHPLVNKVFDRICREREVRGRVLEIGAVPSGGTLLCLPALAEATEKVGINLDGPHDFRGFHIRRGNANAMDMFADAAFDAVLCNAVLEHDPRFWRTLAEIRRVTRPGGTIVIGVPGYRWYRRERLKRAILRIPGMRRLAQARPLDSLLHGTLTLEVHDAPGDFYRFSEQAVRDVFFEGSSDVRIETLMRPPRIVGSGVKD